MKDKNLKASTFRLVLVSTLSVSILASIAATYFGQSFLRSNSESVIQAVSTEFSSKNRLEQLQKAESELKKHSESIEKSKQIASSGVGFAYQQQLIDDINRYAARAGIAVTGYSFSEGGASEAVAQTSPTPAAPAGDGATGTAAPGSGGPAGMSKVAVSVSFVSPIDYDTLMRFLTILETSLPKINAQSIQINRSESNPNEVNMSSLNLEVYIKQ